MHILDFTAEEIAAALDAERDSEKSLGEEQNQLNARLRELTAQRGELEKKARDATRRREMFEVVQAICTPFPEEIWELRTTIAEKEAKSRKTDSKREAAQLSDEAANLKKELLAKCPHHYAINAEGYKAYPNSSDEDRSEPGERFCAVCNHHEREYATWAGGEGGYKQLVEAEHRVWAVGTREKIDELRKKYQAITDFRELLLHFTPRYAIELLEKRRNPPTT